MTYPASYVKIIKFLISGGSAAVVEYGVFVAILHFTPVAVVVAQTVSFLCGFVISFLLNKKWVFKSDGNSKKELIQYSILAATNLVLSNVVLWLMISIVGLFFWIAKLVVMAMVATWNYFIFQKIIFKHEK